MEVQEKLTQLKAQIALVRDLKITILCHKAKLRGLLRRPTREHVSGNTLIRETARVLWLIRKTTKILREARVKLNQLYFELGGESGAKDLKCLTQKLKEKSPIVKVTGYLGVKEVRTLMEAMLKFLYDRDSDSEKFGLEINWQRSYAGTSRRTQRGRLMKLVNLIEESFTEYKKPHMLLGFPYCSFKCDREHGSPICQNSALVKAERIEIPVEDIIARYLSNDITKSVVCAGLEPFDSFEDVLELVDKIRVQNGCKDDIVIYTGYYPFEIREQIKTLSKYENIIVKFGRFIPEHQPHFDKVLGIQLASENQFAEIITEAK